MLHAAPVGVPRLFTLVKYCAQCVHDLRGTMWNTRLSTSRPHYSQQTDKKLAIKTKEAATRKKPAQLRNRPINNRRYRRTSKLCRPRNRRPVRNRRICSARGLVRLAESKDAAAIARMIFISGSVWPGSLGSQAGTSPLPATSRN